MARSPQLYSPFINLSEIDPLGIIKSLQNSGTSMLDQFDASQSRTKARRKAEIDLQEKEDAASLEEKIKEGVKSGKERNLSDEQILDEASNIYLSSGDFGGYLQAQERQSNLKDAQENRKARTRKTAEDMARYDIDAAYKYISDLDPEFAKMLKSPEALLGEQEYYDDQGTKILKLPNGMTFKKSFKQRSSGDGSNAGGVRMVYDESGASKPIRYKSDDDLYNQLVENNLNLDRPTSKRSASAADIQQAAASLAGILALDPDFDLTEQDPRVVRLAKKMAGIVSDDDGVIVRDKPAPARIGIREKR